MPQSARPVLDDLPDAVVIADADQRVVELNETAVRMLRTTREASVGAPLAEVLVLDDLEGHEWCACLLPYSGFELRSLLTEQGWFTPDGRELLVTARLVRERPRGPVVRVVVSLRDARARAHNDRQRSDLVATVAHELRSPLTGVKGFTATLLNKWERFSDSQKLLMLQTVDSDADRLTRLITELLDAARIDSGRMRVRREPVELSAVVRKVLANISAGSGRQVPVRIEGDIPTIWADGDRLAQVVTNLVENALTHGGGRVEISLAVVEDRQAGVELCVDDEGPGFPQAVRGRVFNKFWHSGTSSGSGLGLYIVRGVVEALHGTVSIGDAPIGGARVRLWLPVAEPASLSD